MERYHGKCEELHGHTYRLAVSVEGDTDSEGMVIDFIELKEIVKENVLKLVDHKYINDILDQPTAENLAMWVFRVLEPFLKSERRRLVEVTVWETATSSATYKGDS